MERDWLDEVERRLCCMEGEGTVELLILNDMRRLYEEARLLRRVRKVVAKTVKEHGDPTSSFISVAFLLSGATPELHDP